MPDAPETILAVDDNEAGRYVTARILRHAGFHVLEAASGEEALRLVSSERPQLVVLDVNMPGIDGMEVCRRIKRNQLTSSTLVLQVSATSIATPDRVKALDAGADSFLIEPVEPEELVAVARALLRLHRAEAALKASLADKEVLLKEVNHRVKNNLQIVSSFLNMQARTIVDPEVRQKLEEMQNRVFSLAAIHEQLYRSADVAEIDFHDYTERLIEQLSQLYQDRLDRVQLILNVERVMLTPDTAINLGLIMNELLSNAFKHAFPGDRTGTITISLACAEDDTVSFHVADNGCGIPAMDQPDPGSLGLRLVESMAQRLDANLMVDGSRGTAVTVSFAIESQDVTAAG